MSLQRRFLNVIVDNLLEHGVRSLSFIDLKRLQLFNPTTPPTAAAAHGRRSTSESAHATSQNIQEPSLGMELFRLPSIIDSSPTGRGSGAWFFEACYSYRVGPKYLRAGCFPLADRKVLCTDQCGRSILFDADTHQVKTMPTLHEFNGDTGAVSLFVPSAGDGGSLFLMPRRIGMIGEPCGDHFQVVIYSSKDGLTTCHSQLLPPPPLPYDPSSYSEFSISSYGIVGDGSICISVDSLGTYCLDTASYTWSKVGEWMLPFYGKIQYVPELGLWFGFSADDAHHLAAADLSAMDAQPQLVATWKELNKLQEEGWMEQLDAPPKFVYLGSGRFCIARSYQIMNFDLGSKFFGHGVSVFTGVEVVPRFHYETRNGSGCGRVKLEMVCHKSKCHVDEGHELLQVMDMF